ncbi:noncanonical pyrimidine nucleotidase, YjjG family [Arachidicoccus ginsenosidimutans]|uniref:YjjG family noncanonical pyrimidine nucleotidase n=1 Tax=Arachidicoccus sp. BS20 TaxID=1850526 RepID=UPI0007F0B977|nr:YjjG family noncanonical pyrimidine nucleotidase [Arachidicoccus sp. BS20]ANI90719.1 noncanonical pyrimidine nucleotidase, YjjG family [Arachidicoccus sp. BS20]
MTKYTHLFFDLDHTIWDFEANAKDALYEAFSENKLIEKGIDNYEIFYEKYAAHNHRLWDRYSKGFIKQDELKWKRMWLTMLDYKIADEALAKKLSDDFLQFLPLRKKVFPYTFEILTYLKNKNYRLHLITNGFNYIQTQKLQNAGLTHFFEELITSEASGSLKPNKEIFEFALNKTKALVNESIMLGDNIEADIRGAKNFGLDTVFVNHIKAETEVQPTFEITHLKQLEDIF